ncbi:glycosyltransferase family 2 protein [Nonomuraea spiralis]|uniref:glycosyltransferase family 2 protein n=1 Tax=Nonomuraea spiralis TaxID=46182 RepID=UPI0037A20BD2
MITVVIPTVGRATLRRTLAAVGSAAPVIVVDDRRAGAGELELPGHVRVVRSGGRGPAAARNAGWRAAGTPWVVFLDDDVVPGAGWAEAVRKDLADLPDDVAGSQGRVEVPLPGGRRPTDAERNTAGLSRASWVTADMAYRRSALERIGGFDERFPRAYREDADIALRVERAGHRLVVGERVTAHPVREDGFWAGVRFQRGNADDALMRRLHGPRWRRDIGGSGGRLRRHAVTSAAGLAATSLVLAAPLTRAPATPRPPASTRLPASARLLAMPRTRVLDGGWREHGGWRVLPVLAAVAGALWAAMTAEFAWRRIAPGPRTAREVWRMVVTSLVIPPVACVHRLRGEWKWRR